MRQDLLPGAFVRHPSQEDWGPGQVRSAIAGRVAVSFERSSKHIIACDAVAFVVAMAWERMT